jgi:hypothetical protein
MNKTVENHDRTILIDLLEYAKDEEGMTPESDILSFLYSIRDSLSEGLERRRRDAINVIHGGVSSYSRMVDSFQHPLFSFYHLETKKATLDSINSMIDEVLDESDITQYAIAWDIDRYTINNPRFIKTSDDNLYIYEILFSPKEKFYTNITLAKALSLIVNGEKFIFMNDPDHEDSFDAVWSLHDIFDGKSLSEEKIKSKIKKLFILETGPSLNEMRDAITEFNGTLMKCKECGKYFELTWTEKMFFEQKGLAIPKRCKPCRDKRKKAKDGDNKCEEK